VEERIIDQYERISTGKNVIVTQFGGPWADMKQILGGIVEM
jgi:hypothetical protein